MSYQALARKYRPETFDRVVGQTHVTTTLRAALRKDKLSHAYLFAGPRGCGKTTVARLLAKAINCLENREGDPCGTCDTCQAIAAGNYLDVLEIDAASNTGVDNIRELRDMAQYSPSEGSNRVFIIDEVHMLSKGAFNALLKILEEPPARVYFCFATTEPNKIPRTILSRCQRFDFRLMSRDELGERLNEIASAEDTVLEPAALRLLVSMAEGSVRDGLSLLDQVIAGCDGSIAEQDVVDAFGLVRSEVYLELNEAIVARDAARALRLVEELAASGQSLDEFSRGVVTGFRNLLLLKIDPELAPMVDLPPDLVERLRQHADHFSEQDLLALIDLAGTHFERIHRSTQPRILLEASLVEYCRFESRVLLSDLARRLEALGGAPTGAAGGGGSVRPAPAKPATPPRASGGSSAKPASRAAATVGDTDDPWTRLIDDLMRRCPRVASCLMLGRPQVDLDAGRLTVEFGPDKKFQVKTIEADCPTIAEAATAVWGRPLKVVLGLGDTGQTESRREEIRQEVAPTHGEELQQARAEDPALDSLVDLMGGEPLPESERENWKSGD
ncbi:MAG: DNA polymerase III subunit gamma/tau [bacterium]|nr:DNA polymerase III subunit gamma/tau [bacterium]